MNQDNSTNNDIKNNENKDGNIQKVVEVKTNVQPLSTEVQKELALQPEQSTENIQKITPASNSEVPKVMQTAINGVDLKTLYDIKDRQGVQDMETPSFFIDPKSSKYVQKYLDRVQGIQNTLYAPGVYADPFFDIEVDVGRGRMIGENFNLYTKKKTSFRPGVVNSVPIAISNANPWNDQIAPMAMKVIEGEVPLTNNRIIEMCAGYRAKTFNHNFQPYPFNNMTLHYGGDSYSNFGQTFVLRGGLEKGVTDAESYITVMGAEYQQLNYSNDSVKNLFYNNKMANLRFCNQYIKNAIEWLYNNGRRDPLAYNCFAQQLKLMLYMDQVSCGYDHIENWNSNYSRQFMVDKTGNVNIYQNVNNYREAGHVAQQHGGEFSWCTLKQYRDYMDCVEHKSQWLTKDPYFVPILREHLQRGNAPLAALILSLYPYPLFTTTYNAQHIEVNAPNCTTRLAAFEPLSARIDIQGHEAICFVVVDSDDETDPNVAGYDDVSFSLIANGNTYRLANLIDGPPVHQNLWHDDYNGEGNLFLWDWVQEWYNVNVNEGDAVWAQFSKINKWEVSLDVLNFAAMLTTMPISLFERGGNDPTPLSPNLQLTNLLAFDNVKGSGYHWNMGEPVFCQRLMALLGLVRQKNVTAIYLNDYQRFRRMMYGTRMALGSCCAQLLATARNEISVIYPSSDLPLSNYYLSRRQSFAILFESTFIKSNSILRPGISQDPSRGIFAWVIPVEVVPGTYCQNMGTDDPIREYCNVEDWVDFMNTDLTTDRWRFVKVPESVKEFGSVQHKGAYYWFVTNEVGRKPTDLVMASFSDMYGRTVFRNMDLLKYAPRSGPNADVIQGDVWLPIYNTSHFTWDADRNNATLDFTYVTAWGTLPFIRCLDYTMPTINTNENIPYKLAIPMARVNDWYAYICVERWDSEYVAPVKDLVHVPAFPALNPL